MRLTFFLLVLGGGEFTVHQSERLERDSAKYLPGLFVPLTLSYKLKIMKIYNKYDEKLWEKFLLDTLKVPSNSESAFFMKSNHFSEKKKWIYIFFWTPKKRTWSNHQLCYTISVISKTKEWFSFVIVCF